MTKSRKLLIGVILLNIAFSTSNSSMCFGQQRKTIEFNFYPVKNGMLKFSTESFADTNCYYYVNGDTTNKRLIIPNEHGKKSLNYNWSIPLILGENRLSIYLNDTEGNQYSQDTLIYYKHFGYWILSVGTGDNQPQGSPRNSLKCSPSDAELFASIVKQTIGEDEEFSVCLTGTEATKKRIRSEACRIGDDIRKKQFEVNHVFLYFSGHGGKDHDKFYFRVNDSIGLDTDTMTYDNLINLLDVICKIPETTNVWLFADACESQCLTIENSQTEANIIINPSQILDGENLCAIEVDCDTIKKIDSLFQIVSEGNCITSLKGKAIDGLYMNFLKKVLDNCNKPIRYGLLYDSINRYYNNRLVDKKLKGRSANGNDNSPVFPIHKIQISDDAHSNDSLVTNDGIIKKIPVRFVEVAIGWNLSRQWNPQIGYSWPRWSVFVDFSGRKKWTNTITHTDIPESDTLARVLPSQYIIGMGLGVRWYPDFFSFGKVNSGIGLVNLGLGLSAQTGIIYGEKKISEVETVKHKQSYTCLTPTISIKAFVSRRHQFMWYFNVGYACYIHPCSINHELELKPFVTNFGISIPVCFNNKKTIGGEDE